jgi:hypothetical protein
MLKKIIPSEKGKDDPALEQETVDAGTCVVGSVLGQLGFEGPSVVGHGSDSDVEPALGVSQGPGKLAKVFRIKPDKSIGEEVKIQ